MFTLKYFRYAFKVIKAIHFNKFIFILNFLNKGFLLFCKTGIKNHELSTTTKLTTEFF